MNQTYILSQLESNPPFVICCDEDRMYYSDSKKPSKDYCEIFGQKVWLKKGAKISEEEEKITKDLIEAKIGPANKQMIEEKFANHKRIQSKLLLVNFINYFLRTFDGKRSYKDELKDFELDTKVAIDPDKLKLNFGESKSVLHRKINNSSKFIFMTDVCYELLPRNTQGSCDEICIKGEKYSLKYHSSAEEFDKNYKRILIAEAGKKVKQIANSNTLSNDKHLEKILDAELAKYKEDALGRVGYMSFGKEQHFMFIYYPEYYILSSSEATEISEAEGEKEYKEYGYFPPCRLGLKIFTDGCDLFYTGDVKILSEQYKHPAIHRWNNPEVCLEGEQNPYPGAKVPYSKDDFKIFRKNLRTCLIDACNAIKAGLNTKKDPETGSTLRDNTYHSGIDAGEFVEYEFQADGSTQRPVGWANKLLEKEKIPKIMWGSNDFPKQRKQNN